MNEIISRFLLTLEAIALLLPLSLLYGLLFSIVFGNGALFGSATEPGLVVAMLLAGGGLAALWRLLTTAIVWGIAALRRVHPAWMAFCMLVAVWVIIAVLVQFWISFQAEGSRVPSDLEGIVLGLFGVPALIPVFHLAAELRWRAGGAA